MSNFKKTSEFTQALIDELMKCVRKNTAESPCINAFESLLGEINDENLVRTVIADMNKVIEEFMLVFKETDKIDNQIIQARMLTYEFIKPERFFKNTVKAINQYVYLNAAINAKFFYNDAENGAVKYDIGNYNRLGSVWKEQFYKVNDPNVGWVLAKFKLNDPENLPYHYVVDLVSKNVISTKKVQYTMDEYVKKMMEECRRVILIWNYCPAIVKAILQTKRRGYGLDANSKKF